MPTQWFVFNHGLKVGHVLVNAENGDVLVRVFHSAGQKSHYWRQ